MSESYSRNQNPRDGFYIYINSPPRNQPYPAYYPEVDLQATVNGPINFNLVYWYIDGVLIGWAPPNPGYFLWNSGAPGIKTITAVVQRPLGPFVSDSMEIEVFERSPLPPPDDIPPIITPNIFDHGSNFPPRYLEDVHGHGSHHCHGKKHHRGHHGKCYPPHY